MNPESNCPAFETDPFCEEVTRLVEGSVKEITLLGQILNPYGHTEFETVNGTSPLFQRLKAVHEVMGLERIRFTFPHPVGYRDDFVAAFAPSSRYPFGRPKR